MDNEPEILSAPDDGNTSLVPDMSKVGVVENSCIPYEGMVFDNEHDAHQFYCNYGEIVGFSVRIQAARKNKDGRYTSRVYVCSREGFRRPDKRQHLVKKSRLETRNGCGATMRIKLEKSTGKYVVYGFIPEHNHEVTRPDLSHMVSSQQRDSVAQSEHIKLGNHSGGVRCRLSEGREIGKNYLRTKRQNALAFGEAGSILKYFQLRKQQGWSIFYSIQLDSEDNITNIFWVDGQMRDDYGYFGDTVSLDTTYKVHRDSRPFVIFSGFNHHREATIFGAALMYDETVDSYTWLFETFLKAMKNKHPKTIVTDQDAAIGEALEKVMPDTYHRLCRWHIMLSALQEVHYTFMTPEDEDPCNVLDVLEPFFDEPEEEKEWLDEWNAMLGDFGARENTWLKMIFQLRKKWAPPYVRRHWLAGMQYTQLIKSTNADLNGCIWKEYDISQFFTRFESLVEDIRNKEREADCALTSELPEDKVPTRFLRYAGQIYTKEIFEEIREEFIMSLEMDLMGSGEEGGCQFFKISPPPCRDQSHRVTRDRSMLTCTCRLFNMQGTLCGHMIKVLREVMCIHEIPGNYILKRWTRLARLENLPNVLGNAIDSDWKIKRSLRYEALNSICHKILSKACETEETFELAMKQGEEILNSIEGNPGKWYGSGTKPLPQVGSATSGSEGTNSQAEAVVGHASNGSCRRSHVK